jgi:hypothetical protein
MTELIGGVLGFYIHNCPELAPEKRVDFQKAYGELFL